MRLNGRVAGRRRMRRRGPPGDLGSAALVQLTTAPACAIDRLGRIVTANHALEVLLGSGVSGGLEGRTLVSLTYPPDADRSREALESVFDDGLDRYQVDNRCVRVDTRELVWGTWDLSLVRDHRGRPGLAIAMVRDLTQMKRSEQERRFFEFMFKLIGEAEDSHAVLTAAVQTICHFTRCGMGQVWLPAGEVLVCSPSWYHSGYGFEKLHAASEQLDYQRGEGLPGLAWATGKPQLLPDVRDPEQYDRAAQAQRAGVREAMAVPVMGAAGAVAVLELFVTHERAGEPGRLERIAKVAAELGPLVERRRAEEALRASEQRFRAVTDAAVDAIVSADAFGRLLSWNSGAERMFGWKAEEVVGRPLTVIIPERLRALHEAGIARVRQSGHSKLAGSVVELIGLRRDGGEFPIELSIGAWDGSDGLAFSGVIRDITERKQAEVTLRASEARFTSVADAAVDAIVSADAFGRLLSWNSGAERMFGWRSEEVVGRPLTVIIPERLRALHEAGITRVRESGHSKLAGSVVELIGLRRDGSEFPVELSIGSWQGPDGMAFSAVIRDITERKQAEAALAATNRELERTNAELETLVYSASHDLKSPMVSLLGYLEYLKLDYGDVLGQEGGRYVARISDCTLYMQRLIHDLIDLSRVGRTGANAVDVDLAELVGAIVDEAAGAHPGVGFRIGRLPVVAGDPVGFRQLFTNLVENAVRHGGRPDLTVTVEGRSRADGGLELSVRDDGRGIPPEHRERVFGVFERLDTPSTSSGTGMGLAICRKIVELLGGSIGIHGGRGTEVRIVLPAAVTARWPARELTVEARHDRGAVPA
jgi:two-component system, LuxR family, sensor kinase FixL